MTKSSQDIPGLLGGQRYDHLPELAAALRRIHVNGTITSELLEAAQVFDALAAAQTETDPAIAVATNTDRSSLYLRAAAPKSEGAVTGEPDGWSWILRLPMGSFIETKDGGVKPVRRTKQCLTTFKPDVSDPDVSDVRALYLAPSSPLPAAPECQWCECYHRYAVSDECANCDHQFKPTLPAAEDRIAAARHYCATKGRCSDVTDGCACSDDELLARSPLPAAREEVGVTEAMVEAALAEWRDSTSLSPRDVMRSILEAALRQAPAAPSQEAALRGALEYIADVLSYPVSTKIDLRGWSLHSPNQDRNTFAAEIARTFLASPQGQESGVTKP